MFNKLKTLHSLFSDLRESMNPRIDIDMFGNMANAFSKAQDSSMPVSELLESRPAKASLTKKTDWHKADGECDWQLTFSNSLFAEGRIRFFKPSQVKRVLIFFPGTLGTAADLIGAQKDTFGLREYCEKHSIGLGVWDWPLQGERKNGLYKNFNSYSSIEREYSRTLGLLGTSLWREYAAEASFCMKCLGEVIPDTASIEVCGWSQGALFAWFAPFFGLPIRQVTIAGSCALFQDLLEAGKPHIHGYFYYPAFGQRTIDLDDVLMQALQAGVNVSLIHGEEDRGCLSASVSQLQHLIDEKGLNERQFKITRLPGIGHKFPGPIRDAFFQQFSNRSVA